MSQPERIEQSDSGVVTLSRCTAMHLQCIRAWEGEVDAVVAQLDHVRCNVLMRKGLVENVGPGRWVATPLGRRAAVRMKG